MLFVDVDCIVFVDELVELCECDVELCCVLVGYDCIECVVDDEGWYVGIGCDVGVCVECGDWIVVEFVMY